MTINQKNQQRALCAIALALLMCCSANAATVVGGSALLSGADATQLQTWLGEGSIHLAKVFSKVPGDGKTSADFNNATNNIGRTFSVMQVLATQGNAANVIGGYNPQNWSSSGYNITFNSADRTAFIFNLTSGVNQPQDPSYANVNGQYQTYNDANWGPAFGNGLDIGCQISSANGLVSPASYNNSGVNILGTGGFKNVDYGIVEVFAICVDNKPDGPVYPGVTGLLPKLPQDCTFTSSAENGPPNDGSIAKTSGAANVGKTWSFSNIALTSTDTVYWGFLNNQIRASLNNDPDFTGGGVAGANEIFTYQPGSSNLANGHMVWQGTSFHPSAGNVRTMLFTVDVTRQSDNSVLPLTLATSIGLPANVGGVVKMTPLSPAADKAFNVHMLFTETSIPNTGALNWYNFFAPNGGRLAYFSVTGSFLYSNTPPTFATTIPDQFIALNGNTGPLNITLADSESGAPGGLPLIVSATSSDQSIVPNANITLGGSGLNRTVTVQAATGGSGTATITLTLYDTCGDLTTTTFKVTANFPPKFVKNTGLNVNQRTLATITTAMMQATDADSPTSEITYLLMPGSTVFNGILNNTITGPILAGGSFTQQDIDLNHITYIENVSNTTGDLSDNFQFNIFDKEGAEADAGGFPSFSFKITINFVNRPPVVTNGSYPCALGATINGNAVASDPDFSPPFTPQALTYSIVAPFASKGTVTAFNTSTGAFTYQATLGKSGSDTINFQVSDGFVAKAGTITITIKNQPPTAVNGSTSAIEGAILSMPAGTLKATDPDLPPQPITFRLGVAGSGAVSVNADGSFTYTPAQYFFGTDSFTFIARDSVGADSVLPGTFTISVRPVLTPGDIIVTDQGANAVILIDPITGKQFILSQGGLITGPQGVAVEPGGNSILVVDGNPMGGNPPVQVLRIDLIRGTQSVVVPGSFGFGFALGVAAESSGNFLVADGNNGIFRFDANGTLLTTYPPGGASPMIFPVGVSVAPNGDIIVADLSKFAGQPSRIVRISGGIQTIEAINTGVAPNDKLQVPLSTAVDSAGIIYVGDANFFGNPDLLIRLDPGAQTVIATNPPLSQPSGIAVASNGKLLTANNGNKSIIQVDPLTLVANVISQNGLLQQPWGIALIPNSVPVANNKSVVVSEGTPPVSITVTASDADNGPRPLTYILVTPPVNGLLTGTLPNVVYTPANTNVGSDSFQFKVNDGIADSNVATVSITVNNVAPSVTITGAPASSPEGTLISLTGNVSDPGSAVETYRYTWNVSKNGVAGFATATTTIASLTNPFSFTPNDPGSYIATLTVTDGNGGTGTASASIAASNVAPTVTIGLPGGPYNPGVSVTVTGNAPDPSAGETYTYSWSVSKNGQAYTSGTTNAAGKTSPFTFTPDDASSFAINLSVTDSNGGTGVAVAQTIVVANVGPSALSVTPNPATINENTSTSISGAFTDPGAAKTHVVSIDWGEGSAVTTINLAAGVTSYGSAPHTYLDNPAGFPTGTFTITVTVTDNHAATTSNTATVTVNNVAPTAAITSPLSSPEGTAITLASTVTDPSPVDQAAGFTYAWTVKDPTSTTVATGILASITFTPVKVGNYTVSLTATDKDGGVSPAATATINVTNIAPTVTITGAPASSPEGTLISLTGNVSDPGSAVETYRYTWNVSKNGVAGFATATTTIASLTNPFSFTPNDPGSYIATLTVTDGNGGTGTASASIAASNVAPTVTIGLPGGPYNPGVSVTVTGNAPDPSAGETYTYSWSVSKNGQAYTSGTTNAAGKTSPFTFTPDDASSFAINLSVTDSNGGTGVAVAQTIVVANVGPSALSVTPNPATINENTSTSISGAFTDPGAAKTHVVSIDWGDGSAVTTINLAAGVTSYGPTPHTYLDNPVGIPTGGTFTITVTVTDNHAASNSNTTTVTVNNVAPTAVITAPLSSPEGAAITLTSTVTDPSPVDSVWSSVTFSGNTNQYVQVPGGVPISGSSFTFEFWANLNAAASPYVLGQGPSSNPDTRFNVGFNSVTTFHFGFWSDDLDVPIASPVGTWHHFAGTYDSISKARIAYEDGVPIGSNFAAAPLNNAADLFIGEIVPGNGTPFNGRLREVRFWNTVRTQAQIQANMETQLVGNEAGLLADWPFNDLTGTTAKNIAAGGTNGNLVNGPVLNPPFDYAWNVTGTATFSGTTPNFSFTPTLVGPYTATLTATDKDGGVSPVATTIINVTNVAPSVTISGAPVTSPEGTILNLIGTLTDPGSGVETYTYNWSVSQNGVGGFATGTTTAASVSNPFSFTPNAPGSYVVNLTVTDGNGGTGTASASIVVSNVPPSVSITPPGSASEGTPITITGNVTDQTATETFTYAWSVTKAGAAFASGTTAGAGVSSAYTFTPGAAGAYTVALTVTDQFGASGSASVALPVANTPPIAGLAPSFATNGTGYVDAGGGINLNGSFSIEFWAQRNAPGVEGYVAAQGTYAMDQGLAIGFRSTDVFTFAFLGGDDLDTAAAYSDVGWHHWACTFDSSTNTRSIYRDGVQVAQLASGNATNTAGGSNFLIGRFGVTGAPTPFQFDGQVDEFRIWNSAITPAQIQANMSNRLPSGTAGMTAYYRFDEGSGTTVSDFSGNGNTGTIVTPSGFGFSPVGFVTNGTGYVDAGNGINLDSPQSFSIECRARHIGNGSQQLIAGMGQVGNEQGLQVGFRGSDNFFFGFWGDDLDTAAQYPDANWHQWACTYDNPSNTRTIYLDGVQVAQDNPAGGFTGSSLGNFNIGQFSNGLYPFTGDIDEFRIWNSAITQTQIQANMNSTNLNPSGMIAYYLFDQASGTTVADSSGNGNTGTLTGGTGLGTGFTTSGPTPLLFFTNENVTLNSTLAAFDFADAITNYSIVTNGAGTATIPNAGNSAFSYAPQANTVGTDTFTYKVNDGTVDSNIQTVNVIVNTFNNPPVLAAIPAQTANEGSLMTFTASATDPDANDKLTYTLTGAPAGAAIDPNTGVFTWTSNIVQVTNVTVVVTDSGIPQLSASQSVSLTVANVAPTVTITGAPVTSPEGTAINLTGTVTDPGSAVETYTYTWNVSKNGAAGFATGTTPTTSLTNPFSFTPNDPGSYVANLTVTDENGGTGTASASIAVSNVAPIVTITPPGGPYNEGSPITVTGAASDPSFSETYTYSWSVLKNGLFFTTGTTLLAGQSSLFTFTPDDNGNYTVGLTITDSNGASGTATPAAIPVANVAPTLNTIAVTASINEGSTATLTGNIVDPGVLDNGTLAITWGDGSPVQTVNYAAGATTFSVPHQYLDGVNPFSTYSISATVTDKDTGTTPYASAASVTVFNVAPAAVTLALNPATINEGGSTSLSGTFTDPGTLDTHTVLIDWGDSGPTDTLNLAAGVLSYGPIAHTYAQALAAASITDTITVTVTDKDTTFASNTTPLVISNVAPSVTITGNPSGSLVLASSPEGTPIKLNAVVADPGVGDTLSYAWTVNGSSAGVNSSTLTYTPTTDGNYTFSVTATDKAGGAGTASVNIAITNVAPTAILAITAPTGGVYNEGSAVTLTATVTDPSSNETYSYSWTVLKNGSAYTSGTTTSVVVKTSAFTFTPDDNGDYTVGCTITDSNGGSSVAPAVSVPVSNVAPIIIVLTPSATTLNEGDTTFTLSGTFTDPGVLDTHTVDIDWSDGSAHTMLNLAANVLSFSNAPHTYGTGALLTVPYTITVKVTDKDLGFATNNTTVITVNNVAPTVVINGPANATEGTVVNLSSTVSDPGQPADTFTYAWSISGPAGFTAVTGTNATISFTSQFVINGTGDIYTATLTVKDAAGASSPVASKTITVTNIPAAVAILGAPASSPEGTALTLTGTAASLGGGGQKFVYSWNVAKNGTAGFATQVSAAPTAATTDKFTFTPDDNGNYVVNLIVTDLANGKGTATQSIVVTNVAPTPTIIVPGSLVEGTPVTLTSSVFDPSKVDVAAGFKYSWIVSVNGAVSATSNSSTLTFTPDAAAYTVALTVTDKDGGTGLTTTVFTVTNIAPTVAIDGAPASSPEGTPIVLTSTVTDPGPNDNLAYAWTVTKNGAGLIAATTPGLTFTPDDNGAYAVSLSVTDSSGAVTTALTQIAVTNVAPSVTINNAPPLAPTGTFIFLTSTVTDPSSADTLVGFSYAWTLTSNGNPFMSGAAANFSFVATGDTTYGVTLTVGDKDGGKTTATAKIVSDAAPVIVSGPTAIPNPGIVGQAVNFSCTATDGDAVTWVWDFGDGTGDNSNSNTVNHIFTIPATFIITVTSTDATGHATSKSLALPVISSVPTPGGVEELVAFLGSNPFNGPLPAPLPLNISKTQIRLNFTRQGQDSISLTGALTVPPGVTLLNQLFALDVNGVLRKFNLDKHGNARSNGDTVRYTAKKALFSVRLAHGTYAPMLAQAGLTGAQTVTAVQKIVNISLIFNQQLFQTAQPVKWTAKAGKSGSAK